MEIEKSSLFREIKQIITGGEKPVHYQWSALVHIGDKETLRPLRISSIDFKNDYLNNYAVEMHITMEVLAGTYAKRIYPYLNNIDITLSNQPIGEVSETRQSNQMPSSERYTAILIDTGNPTFEMSGRIVPSEDALNLSGMFTVTFQLLDKSLEKIRALQIGGLYNNVTGEELVKALLTKACRTVSVDEERKLKGVDMVPASNQIRRDIVIPQGLSLTELPHYLHFKCGGLYSAGLGYYLSGDYWYVYPSYDVKRFNQALRTLTIINVPPNRFPGIERTYRLDGDNLVILSTGQVRFRQRANTSQLNDGNGVRFADAKQLMSKFTVTGDNKVIMNRANVNSEFIAQKRQHGDDVIKMGRSAINANVFVEYSALAKRQGSLVALSWENSNRSLLRPGMPVKILQLDGNEIQEYLGVLSMSHDYVSVRDSGFVAKRYVTSSMLGVFINAQVDNVE